MNSYEMKQEARRARLEAAAERARARAAAAYKRADLREEASGIPFGQPILVGHHSEGRHRAAIRRADNAMRRSIAEDKRAGELAARADAVGTGGISSDDPDAVAKLREKLAGLENDQKRMKAGNALVRARLRKSKPIGEAEYLERMAALDIPAKAALGLLDADFAGRVGFPSYALSNNNAEIRRVTLRIKALAAKDFDAPAKKRVVQTDAGEVEIIENFEENRLQLVFDGKPDADVRAALKSCGFRWAPSVKAWQRQLNNGARYAADRVLAQIGGNE